MTLEESREVIPMMESMINQIEEQQKNRIEQWENENQQWQELTQKLNSENSELLILTTV